MNERRRTLLHAAGYALRLHEVGMIKSTPQKILERGTDWRFLDEIRKELKA